jgi:uncharacterized protein YfdQ (DUF2303 family)
MAETTNIIPDAQSVVAITNLAREGMLPHIETCEFSTPLAIWPRQQKIESLEHLLQNPLRKRGKFQAQTSDAFIGYVQQHRTPGLLLTGTVTTAGGSFHADLDGHEPNIRKSADEGGGIAIEGEASWRTHHAHLDLKPSPEWEKWLGKNAQQIEQGPFAEFIEDNSADIVVPTEGPIAGAIKWPDAATMMAVATTLEAKTDVQFSSGIRLQNGQQRLTYLETVNGSAQGAEGTITIPEKFAIAIQPFVGAPKYQLIARLRYYCSRGKVTFRYEIERPYRVIEDAYQAERKKIEEAIGQPVLLGTIA